MRNFNRTEERHTAHVRRLARFLRERMGASALIPRLGFQPQRG